MDEGSLVGGAVRVRLASNSSSVSFTVLCTLFLISEVWFSCLFLLLNVAGLVVVLSLLLRPLRLFRIGPVSDLGFFFFFFFCIERVFVCFYGSFVWLYSFLCVFVCREGKAGCPK